MCQNPLAYIYSSSFPVSQPKGYHVKFRCHSMHNLIFTDPDLSSDCEQYSKLAEEMSYIKVHLFFLFL